MWRVYGQDKGTDVLIFTLGNVEMEMGLSFPETMSRPNECLSFRIYTLTRCRLLTTLFRPPGLPDPAQRPTKMLLRLSRGFFTHFSTPPQTPVARARQIFLEV